MHYFASCGRCPIGSNDSQKEVAFCGLSWKSRIWSCNDVLSFQCIGDARIRTTIHIFKTPDIMFLFSRIRPLFAFFNFSVSAKS